MDNFGVSIRRMRRKRGFHRRKQSLNVGRGQKQLTCANGAIFCEGVGFVRAVVEVEVVLAHF